MFLGHLTSDISQLSFALQEWFMVQGKENIIADALSRVCPLSLTQHDYKLETILINIISRNVLATATTLQEF